MALKRYPGFIDVHVHLREPGATHKEDFYTGSRAAAKGGVTMMLDMPNNPTPTITIERLDEKIALAKKAIVDIGFHFGTNGKNIDQLLPASKRKEVYGLKLYCNHTTGEMLIEDLALLEKVYAAWESPKPILLHAEGIQLAGAIGLATAYGRRVHMCHISLAIEVELVRRAKEKGFPITAGVCPHHLYLLGEARETLRGFAIMKPPLGTKEDQEALWVGLKDGIIDVVETDHAPHTREEKSGEKPAFGVPGLETMVPLMMKAVKDGRITEERMMDALYTRPKKIFNIPDQPDTYVEIDLDATTKVGEGGYGSKADWSPFEGWELPGKVMTVVIRGKRVL